MQDYELTPLSSVWVTVCLRRRVSRLTGSLTAFLCVASLMTAGDGFRWKRWVAAELLAKSTASRAIKQMLLMVKLGEGKMF